MLLGSQLLLFLLLLFLITTQNSFKTKTISHNTVCCCIVSFLKHPCNPIDYSKTTICSNATVAKQQCYSSSPYNNATICIISRHSSRHSPQQGVLISIVVVVAVVVVCCWLLCLGHPTYLPLLIYTLPSKLTPIFSFFIKLLFLFNTQKYLTIWGLFGGLDLTNRNSMVTLRYERQRTQL